MPEPRLPAVVLALATALVLTTPPAAAAPTATAFAVAELPGLPGYPTHRAIALNDLGQVVGATYGNGAPHAVLWSPGGAATDLGTGLPTAINRRGQVLGLVPVSGAGPYVQEPKIWFEGRVTDLTPAGAGWVVARAINSHGVVPMTYSPSPAGYHQDRASVWRDGRHVPLPLPGAHLWLDAVNDAGVVVGSRTPMSGEPYAFRCPTTDSCAPLAAAPGTGGYAVEAVNEAGVVVGNRYPLALRWEGDAVTVLADQGGVADGPQAINERGDVVGWSAVGGVRRAVVWPGGGKPVVLGVPGPAEAVAVNERGDVVGWTSADDPDAPRAFLWRDGRVTYLGSLGGAHSLPVAINDRGVVVGESTTADGVLKAVRWTPVPTTPIR
ncbi:hypothetical protein ACFFSW_22250 [Saccharothrix longispora]|uniref:HAF family extracellular repeat protein n=1 Tax=Saccharothrix longispora TaxID=33920 RepID=A0ABU1PS64_9PSEU|nr:hypothetical protein [Saccharothrix longispora]MDR6593113.1 putative HAF family extracellular repeat protein [Saccharothrix longispora]